MTPQHRLGTASFRGTVRISRRRRRSRSRFAEATLIGMRFPLRPIANLIFLLLVEPGPVPDTGSSVSGSHTA